MLIDRDKKGSRTNSSSSGPTEPSPNILRHHNMNGYAKPRIKHQNEKMNRATTCRSGVGPEIILTPQEAGANPPHVITMDTLHKPKPSIEIVSTPQEAIMKTNNTLPYSPDMAGRDEENTYEEFDDMYDEFNDTYEEYAEISDFEKTGTSVEKKKKPSIKPKPKANQNKYQTTPKEQTLNDEIMNHLKRRKDLQDNTGSDTARSSTIQMTENDDLYYNSGEVDEDYELAAKVDDNYTEDDNRYYDLQPNKKQMSRKYEQLRYNGNHGNGSDSFSSHDSPAAHPQHRRSQDIYDDDGEYYDDDEWSTEDSTEEYMGDKEVRTSVLAMQDGHRKGFNGSSEC